MTLIRFVVLMAALGLPMSSSAALVTWDFTGQIRAIQGASPATLATLTGLSVTEGSAFWGRLVFESSTPDTDSTPNTWGQYPNAIVRFEFQIGSYHATHPLGSTFAQMDIADGPGSPYGLIQALGGDPTALGLFTTPVMSLVLQRHGVPLWSDALPLVPPELADLDPFTLGGPPHGAGTGIVLFGNDGNIYGELTSIEVPEPAAFLVLLAPLALAVCRRRRSA